MTDNSFAGLDFTTLCTDSPAPGVARLTLNRPAALNAYSFAMTQELLGGIAAFRDSDTLKVLILAGAGTRAFCAGGDLAGSDLDHRAQVASAPMGHGRRDA